jgi:hypothetical protein
MDNKKRGEKIAPFINSLYKLMPVKKISIKEMLNFSLS